MKIKRFENFLNEGKSSDFIMRYRDELKQAIQELKAIGTAVKDMAEDDPAWGKVQKRLSVYDTNVCDVIMNSWAGQRMDVDEIVDFAFRNESRWGTEPQMVVFAIGDAYQVLCTEKKITRENMVPDPDDED